MLRRAVMSLSSRPLTATSARLSTDKIAELELKLEKNSYFMKFKDKIEKLKIEDPDTYVKRLELMLDQTEKQAKKTDKHKRKTGNQTPMSKEKLP